MVGSSLRVKLQTNAPLPEYRCWSVLGDTANLKIHDLRKRLVKYLSIEKEPSLIKLSIDGFDLLPSANVDGLIRDGDLIEVNEDHFVKTEKKRKTSSVYKSGINPDEPAAKKSKKTDKKQKDTAKNAKHKDKSEPSSKAAKKTKEKAVKKSTKSKKEKAIKRKNEKEGDTVRKDKKKSKSTKDPKDKKVSDTKKAKPTAAISTSDSTTAASEGKGLPYQGMSKTQKRNMRRKLLKQRLRSETEQSGNSEGDSLDVDTQSEVPIASNIETDRFKVPENTTLTTSTQQAVTVEELKIPSAQLLKKNKNKKKNHMKDNKAEKKHHVHFDDSSNPTSTIPSNNPYGRAFITVASIDTYNHNYDYSNQNRYPVDNMPTLFYAQQPLDTTELTTAENQATAINEQTVQAEESNVQQNDPAESEAAADQMQTPTVINYDDYPDADFEKKMPSIGDHLAVKTLELTANYTPEISDWKQVILKEFNSLTVTFEYVAGFKKESIKGGKFDINKHRKKPVDDEGVEIDETEGEEEEEEEGEEETLATFNIYDIFAMKNMSKRND